jgi:hypothetical protein
MIGDVAKWVQPLSLAHEGKEHQYKMIKLGENNYETIKIPEYLGLIPPWLPSAPPNSL